MLALVLGLLYYAQKTPTYQSMVQMLVVKKTPTDTLSLGQNDSRIMYMEDYMSTQQVLVRSPAIIGRAAKMPNLQDMKSFPGERPENLVYAIRDVLTVGRQYDYHVGNRGASSCVHPSAPSHRSAASSAD